MGVGSWDPIGMPYQPSMNTEKDILIFVNIGVYFLPEGSALGISEIGWLPRRKFDVQIGWPRLVRLGRNADRVDNADRTIPRYVGPVDVSRCQDWERDI